MPLKNLLLTNNWLSVKAILLEIYPDYIQSISGYEKAYQKLLQIEPIEGDMEIMLEIKEDNNERYVDVLGFDTKENKTYALDFTPWREILGMEIQDTLKNYTELEIITHCLFEMTFYGFNDATIQRKIDSFKASVKELKNMSREEKMENSRPLDERLRELDQDQ